MAIPLRQLLLDGMLSLVVPPPVGTGGTVSAEYCYSVFMRHRVLAGTAGLVETPATVLELGPGDSIGTGILALLTGSERYFGIDVVEHASLQRNAEIFDQLVELLESRAPIPHGDGFDQIQPALEDYAFPDALFPEAQLARSLAPQRISRLKEALLAVDPDGPLRYLAPMGSTADIPSAGVDWIFSQAVMEHVDRPQDMYDECFRCLRAGGLMTHQIDYCCHDTAEHWNGHWRYPVPLWMLMRGRRPWFINRHPHSHHLQGMSHSGFEILVEHPQPKDGGLPRERMARRYRQLADADLATAGAFVVARRSFA